MICNDNDDDGDDQLVVVEVVVVVCLIYLQTSQSTTIGMSGRCLLFVERLPKRWGCH